MNAASAAQQNRYDRTVLGRGTLAWVYEYSNARAIHRRGALATGLEIGVQLRGNWIQGGSRTSARLYQPGCAHVLSPSEAYDLEVPACVGESGLQVGFIVYPDERPELSVPDGAVVFPEIPVVDSAFMDLCRAYQAGADRGRPLPASQVADALVAWVKRQVVVAPPDPIARARRELERTYTSPLYLKHIAEVAGMSPVIFSRKFARRYGTTPIAYRLKLRINEAARLSWSRPDLSVRAIAELVGFDDESYFHRAFVREMGATPAAYARRGIIQAA